VISSSLPTATSVLVVCAHPDDESFGLGGILTAFVGQGTRTAVLCFTHGEASTLNATEDDLATVRSQEFARAAEVLGVSRSELLGYPDGHLAEQQLPELTAHIVRMANEVGADLLLTFDEGGITGHPDHEQATQAAVAAGISGTLPVLAWAVPDTVACALNDEFGAAFVGRNDDQCDFRVAIDRVRQSEAIACHVSQSAWNPVLQRRLELSGEFEHLRWLTPARWPSRTTA
jgi:N-acetylglucosamine malate deacetylase 2